jgi:SAM-dependent methyltransferase
MSDWHGLYKNEHYQNYAAKTFEVIDNTLRDTPKNILDIGCGYADVSRHFCKKYDAHVTLIDCDEEDNQPSQTRMVLWGSAESMKGYTPLSAIENHIKGKIKKYELLNCKSINIDKDKKFDLIYSFLSCGFHYPISTYRELCLKHSHEHTRFFFSLRGEGTGLPVRQEEGIKIIQSLTHGISEVYRAEAENTGTLFRESNAKKKHNLTEIEFV